jgi:nucleoside-diphosphate-sugar epimerase
MQADDFKGLLTNIIVGNGMIASEVKRSWPTSSGFVIFASGVSDSSCIDAREFDREKALLSREINQLSESQALVYFSSCSIYDPSLSEKSPYVRHKQDMESMVKTCVSYQIFRLPQVIGYNKAGKTLVSYFHELIVTGQEMSIQRNARRNLIDVVDVVKLASFIAINKISPNATVNIASTRYDLASYVVKLLGCATNIKPITRYVDGGSSYKIDTKVVKKVSKMAGVVFDDYYLPRVINNYYG